MASAIAKSAGAIGGGLARRSAKLKAPQPQEVLDNYILTSNSRGASPKQVPSKLNGTFEYFTSPYEQNVITWTPSYVMGALKKEVMEKVPWIAPAAGMLYGCVWYAQDYKRTEDMHHRF